MGFLDPTIHCIKLAAEAVGWFKPKRMVMYYTVYLRGKYLNKLEKDILGSLYLLNLQHYKHSLFSYDLSQVIYSLPWKADVGFPFLG